MRCEWCGCPGTPEDPPHSTGGKPPLPCPRKPKGAELDAMIQEAADEVNMLHGKLVKARGRLAKLRSAR